MACSRLSGQEKHLLKLKPDGFELEFTLPINKSLASNLDSAALEVTSFTYLYHSTYGSPIVEKQNCPLLGIEVSEDGLRARIAVDSLREGYIHEIKVKG